MLTLHSAAVGMSQRCSCTSQAQILSNVARISSLSCKTVLVSRSLLKRPELSNRKSLRSGRKHTLLASVEAGQQTTTGKFISKTEIPAFIPRQDLMEQLLRWSTYNAEDPEGFALYGLPVKVAPYYQDDNLWGLSLTILRDGEVATELAIRYDNEDVTKHEWVGRGADGFPTLEGNQVEVKGKNLEIWKMDTLPVDEVLRATIRNICTQLVGAINKYYAFGSAFVDEAT